MDSTWMVCLCFHRDQESMYTEKMQNLHQTLTEERDKVLHNANQQRSVLEESLHSTKTEEQRLRTKLAEAEEVGIYLFGGCWFSILIFVTFLAATAPAHQFFFLV